MMEVLADGLDKALRELAALQRPFYWSWGVGLVGAVNSTRWPRREDKLKRADSKTKDAFRRRTAAFTTPALDGVRTTTRYVVSCNGSPCAESTQSWLDLTSSISSSSPVTVGSGDVLGVVNRSVITTAQAPDLDSVLTLSSNNATNVSWTFDGNTTYYGVFDDAEGVADLAIMVTTAAALALVILATVIGNVFVIAAILLERNLQNVANYLILSLAVADLLVACLVMPLGAVYEVSKQWTLGPELCDMWTSSDVLCCTASILHLVAIALDRYWAVTNIDYIHQRTAQRIGVMIAVIWCVAFAVCIAPLLGWKDPDWENRIYVNQTCLVSQDIGYQVFATASSFYVPLLVILILYWRIFQTARKRIRRRGGAGGAAQPRNPAAGGVVAGAAGGSGGIAAAVVAVIGRPLPTISETTTAFTTVSSTNTSPEKHAPNGIEADLPTADCLSSYQQSVPYPIPIKRKPKEVADSKRERKAAKTLAIITGAFVVCWLPFFILAILLPVCKTCEVNPHFVSFFLWLGYLNSTLNPIIYTIFSPEFRHAFKRLLCGRRASIRRRNVRHFGPRHFQ